jgi:hypothetical protein
LERSSRITRRRIALYAALALTVLIAGLPLRAHAAPGDITTVAGTGTCCGGGADGDGGPALQAHIQPPYGIVTAPGKYYFSENEGFFNNPDVNRVRVVQNGTINSVGGGVYPPTTDGVPATQTFLRGAGQSSRMQPETSTSVITTGMCARSTRPRASSRRCSPAAAASVVSMERGTSTSAPTSGKTSRSGPLRPA